MIEALDRDLTRLVRDEVIDLTDGRVRKPLVGGGCLPFAFRAGPEQDIARIARGPDLTTAVRSALQDDDRRALS